MDYVSLNPATGEEFFRRPAWSDAELERELVRLEAAAPAWREAPVAARSACLSRAAVILRAEGAELAALITAEMGKPIREARAEIEKCAKGCEFFAARAEQWLDDRPVATDARRSLVAFRPLGTILAIMPWNFPFWQVFRAALPALAAGNSVLLKHAPNVPRCAEALESVLLRAGLPAGSFRWLPITHGQTEALIATAAVQAVTLTGSTAAGRRIAALAGAALKKTVLELGGSDPFVVLEDADLDRAAEVAVEARFQNCGQSCIAAKRFILVDAIADDFLARFRNRVESLVVGDPARPETQVGPLARADLRDRLHAQVTASRGQGAKLVTGGELGAGPGFFYVPTVLDRVRSGCPVYAEETFGPVAALVRVPDEAAALANANGHRYGLGGSVWTRDRERGERFARRLDCGVGCINALVRSDPRLPFGGVKESGYGRELADFGLHEFCNVQSLWID